MRISEMDYGCRFLRTALLALVITGIQSCGSSDGSSDTTTAMNDQGVPFTEPVDASTLRSALETGVSAGDLERFWLCDVSTGDQVIAYNLFGNGSGMERNTSTPELSSDLTWQTTSATSMTTVFEGGQLSLTNIQFEGRDDMSLLVGDSLALSCERQLLASGTQVTPPATSEPVGDNQLSYGGVIYPLTEGFESKSFTSPVESHERSNLRLANAPYQQVSLIADINAFPITYFDAIGATVKLSVNLFSPRVPEGATSVDSGIFEFEARDNEDLGPEVVGRFFFNNASLGVDIDNDGGLSGDANEFSDVTDGTISLTRFGGNRSLVTFDLTLANGVSAVGSFENDFFVLP